MYLKSIILNFLATNVSLQRGCIYWRNYLCNSLLLLYTQYYQFSFFISLFYNYIEAFVKLLSYIFFKTHTAFFPHFAAIK